METLFNVVGNWTGRLGYDVANLIELRGKGLFF